MDGFVAAAVGIVAGLVLTPVVRRLALRFDVVDRPGLLKPQQAPVAYLGGVAVFLATATGLVISGRPLVALPLVAALLLGLADDLRPLAVPLRVTVEVGIATGAALAVPGPVLARVATGVLVVGLLNAINLLDGQDGLAAGAGIVSAVGFAMLGGAATPVGLGLAGALAGFLVFNRPPATIYLGDAGAYFVGTTLAVLPALTSGAPIRWSHWWAVPLLVALPVADTAIAIVRRVRARRPILSGDRSHVYDQLVDRGLTIGQSTSVCLAFQAACTALGVLAARSAPTTSLGLTMAAAVVIAGAAVRAGLVTPEAPTASDRDPAD